MFFWVNFHGVAKLAMIQTGLWQEDWTKFGYKLNMKVIFFKIMAIENLKKVIFKIFNIAFWLYV
jgi:hypothetical protein